MFGQVMCQVRSHTPGHRALRAGERTDRIEKRAPQPKSSLSAFPFSRSATLAVRAVVSGRSDEARTGRRHLAGGARGEADQAPG